MRKKLIIYVFVFVLLLGVASATQQCYIPHRAVVNYGGTSYQEMYDSSFVNTDTGNAQDYEFKVKDGEDVCSVTPRNLPEKDVPSIPSSFILGGSYTEDTLIKGVITPTTIDMRILGYKDKNNDGSFSFYLREYNPTTHAVVGTIGSVTTGTPNDENTEYSVSIPVSGTYLVSAGNTLMLQVYASNNACPDGDFEHKFVIDKDGGGSDTAFLDTYCDSFASEYTDYTALILDETPISFTSTLVSPPHDTAIYVNDSFSMTCNMTNTGVASISSVNIYARYSSGSVISTVSGDLTLNESGNYSCGSVASGSSCQKTWNVTGNNFADSVGIECYVDAQIKTVTSDSINIDIFNDVNDLSLSIDKDVYSGGQSVSATLTSEFTGSPYNVITRNSTGGVLCNKTGTTPLVANDLFFSSCNIPYPYADQDNNTVTFYIDYNPLINQTVYFNTSTIQPLEYSINNILLKYDTTFLGYSQSIKGTVIDNESEVAVGQCCRLQIDDAITGAPIFTSPVVEIDGLGSCETHWSLDKNDFVAPKSYSAMMIAWQCSDPTIPASQRKRGYGTTSFEVVQYVTEEDSLVPVNDKDLWAGFDTVTMPHERTNNFGEPIETLTTYWFANTDTEADYHYEYLRNEEGTVNVGTSTKTHAIPIPEDLPSGSYRVEMNVFYSYQGEIKEFDFVKSELFNVSSIQDVVSVDSIIIKDYFDTVVTGSFLANDSADLPNSNYTDPHIVLGEGFGYKVCFDVTNDYDDTIYYHLENIVLHNPTTSQSFSIFDTELGNQWKRPLNSGANEICYNDVLPLTIETHSDWTFDYGFAVGLEDEAFTCEQGIFPLKDECQFSGTSPYFYVGAIEDMVEFTKWIVEPNATSYGQAGTYIVTEREEYMSMNNDCEYQSQSEVDWGNASVTCYDKNDGVTALLTDQAKYPVAGEKFKVCYQIKNYFSDEIALELYDLYMDDDSGETVIYFQSEITENYVPSITDDKVYLEYEPSRADEQQGVLVDGYSNMCSKWIDLPSDIKGGNDWDIQGKVRVNTDVYNLDETVTWRWESDEFSIYGLDTDTNEYLDSNTLTDASSYKIGDEIYVCANVSSTYPETLALDFVRYNYRCSSSAEDSNLDRNLYGNFEEFRSISANGVQNQCHKFIIPDDPYFRAQGEVVCYASTTIFNNELGEEHTSNSPYFNISKHDPDINVTHTNGNNFIYVDSKLELNISLENPLVYKQESLTAHYSVQLQSEESIIYVFVDEINFLVNESQRNFTIDLSHDDSDVYLGDMRNWDLGSGWVQDKRDSFLKKLTSGDQDIHLILDYHVHPPYSDGALETSVTAFQEIFTNFSFKKSGYTHATAINDGMSSGSNYSTTLYLDEDGRLNYYIYFNLTSVSAPDGTYSTAERENWVIIEGEPDGTKRCYNAVDYSYLNNASGYGEYWHKVTCGFDDSQEMLGKSVRMYRQGQFSSTPYVYEPVTIQQPLTVNSLVANKESYVGGEVVYLTINTTGHINRRYNIEAVLESVYGLEVYSWETPVEVYHIRQGTDVLTYALLLPVSLPDSPYDGTEYELELYLTNPTTGKLEISSEVGINVSQFSAVISENITSGTISNGVPVTIDYELNIPLKDMEYFPNANQPFRIKYHFLESDGKQAVTQFDTIDSQYAPLEAYTLFPAGTTQNFSVTLYPTNLGVGNYTIVEEIQIDPPVNGVAVWETVHKGSAGTIQVTETLTNEPQGLVSHVKGTYELAQVINVTTKEINVTTHNIYDYLLGHVNDILTDINYTVNNLNISATVDMSLVYGNLTNIGNDLISLREEVDNNADFDQEAVFLITDSIVATQNSLLTNEKTVIREEMATITNNLEEFKVIALGQEREDKEKETNYFIIEGIGINNLIFIGFGVIILITVSSLIFTRRRVGKNEKNNGRTVDVNTFN